MDQSNDGLPNSEESERSILGLLLMNPAWVGYALERLELQHFYVPSHRHIFAAMVPLFQRDAGISPTLIGAELEKQGSSSGAVGGISFITDLSAGLPIATHVAALDPYIDLLKDTSARRHGIKLAAALSERFKDPGTQLSQTMGWISGETAALERAAVKQVNTLFTRRTMNDWLKSAAEKPIGRKLCGELWAEGELTIFFGGTGEGKTAFAVQVGNDIARGESSTGLAMEAAAQDVLYFDFELSDCQQLRRYAVERRNGDGKPHYRSTFEFAEKFHRIEMDAASRVFDGEWDQTLLTEVEKTIIASRAKIVIVDNITWLSRETEKGKFALPLMQRLCDLKKEHNLSITVQAHTPKRDETRPISLNDLAGSRILANFADSVFAIGKSAKDPRVRYLKQLKVRSTELFYGTDNVAVFQFDKPGNFLGFTPIGQSSEHDHLRTLTDDAREERIARAKALSQAGKTQREIAQELQLSLGTVNKYVHSVQPVQAHEQDEHVNKKKPPDRPILAESTKRELVELGYDEQQIERLNRFEVADALNNSSSVRGQGEGC